MNSFSEKKQSFALQSCNSLVDYNSIGITSTTSLFDFNNLMFNNNKINIILDDKNEPWFKAKDVAIILEYSNAKQAIRVNVDEDDKNILNNFKGLSHSPLDRNEKNTIYINESGLYSLIMSSKKEEAIKFKKWVTKEVLPSIRKYGEYTLSENFKKQLQIKDNELQLKDNELQIKDNEWTNSKTPIVYKNYKFAITY